MDHAEADDNEMDDQQQQQQQQPSVATAAVEPADVGQAEAQPPIAAHRDGQPVPVRTGETTTPLHEEGHRWIFFPKMTRDEVLLLRLCLSLSENQRHELLLLFAIEIWSVFDRCLDDSVQL